MLGVPLLAPPSPGPLSPATSLQPWKDPSLLNCESLGAALDELDRLGDGDLGHLPEAVDWQWRMEEALMERSEAGDEVVLSLLLLPGVALGAASVHGSAFKRVTAGETLSRTAAAHGRARPLQGLAERGADLAARRNGDGATVATLAAARDHLECLQLAVAFGGPGVLLTRDASGVTPALSATQLGNAEMLRYIVATCGEEVLRPELSDGQVTLGEGALPIVAASGGHVEILGFLVEKLSAHILTATADDSGITPAHIACIDGHSAVLTFIGNALGAEPLRMKDGKGRTPLMYLEAPEAQYDAQPECLAVLQGLLAKNDEARALLARRKRLALAKAMQPRLGAGSSAEVLCADLVQQICVETAGLGDMASYLALDKVAREAAKREGVIAYDQ